ncbi:uncharacterized protein LOC125039732 [Penaeus chinensis]|uniref:uncharacterized protein LOC125039732 n=1 Tax=Penaeus chinensis TaxID=139456 RepID=UPI001FB6E30B|nr:uncharacterized protein LOC125039732 [Penaeus chinensis]
MREYLKLWVRTTDSPVKCLQASRKFQLLPRAAMVPLEATPPRPQPGPPPAPPAPPAHTERMADSSVDTLVTTTVALVLALLVIAYLYLCCHVWGLHLRLLALVKCVGRRDHASPRSQHHAHRFPGGRPSISLPVPSAHHRLAVETPPPRYSLVNGSLPSYSCAMLRTMAVVGSPLQFRILVRVGASDLCRPKVSSPKGSQLRPTPKDAHAFSAKLPFLPQFDAASLGPSTSSPEAAVFFAESDDHCCIDFNNNIPLASLHPDALSSSGESDASSGGDREGSVADDSRTSGGDLGDGRGQQDVIKPEVPDKFVKVVVQREGQEAQHCMYARRTSSSCYEARWTMKPEDLTANYTFQVYLEEKQEADVYLEMLNDDGLIMAVDQLSPVPSTRPPAYLTPAPPYTSPLMG